MSKGNSSDALPEIENERMGREIDRIDSERRDGVVYLTISIDEPGSHPTIMCMNWDNRDENGAQSSGVEGGDIFFLKLDMREWLKQHMPTDSPDVHDNILDSFRTIKLIVESDKGNPMLWAIEAFMAAIFHFGRTAKPLPDESHSDG